MFGRNFQTKYKCWHLYYELVGLIFLTFSKQPLSQAGSKAGPAISNTTTCFTFSAQQSMWGLSAWIDCRFWKKLSQKKDAVQQSEHLRFVITVKSLCCGFCSWCVCECSRLKVRWCTWWGTGSVSKRSILKEKWVLNILLVIAPAYEQVLITQQLLHDS